MEEEKIGSDRKGALGELLVFSGNKLPLSVRDRIVERICEEYDVLDIEFQSEVILIHQTNGRYFSAIINEEQKSARFDGGVRVQWVPENERPNIEFGRDERVMNRNNHTTEEAYFPIEVKTGPYAELERDQRDVMETIAAADTRLHPIVIQVSLDKLPEQYEVSTTFVTP